MTGNGNRRLKIFELFKGTGSVGKIANKLGLDVVSLDLEAKYEPDILTDILEWDYTKWAKDNNFKPDLIWSSPPCNTYSPLVYPLKERNPKTAIPYSKRAKLGTQILYRTLEIIDYFMKLNPNLLFVIENPKGMMRNDRKIKKLGIDTTTYCAYGDFKRKLTDFFNNVPGGLQLKEIAPCPNPEMITPVQNLKTIEERYSIPGKLIKDILTRMISSIGIKGGMITDEETLNDFSNYLDETLQEIRTIPIPVRGEDRSYLLELLESLEGFLNIVNEGAEPFENPQRQEFFRNKVNSLISAINSHLSYTTPQPIRPIKLPNQKPKRGTGASASFQYLTEPSLEEKLLPAENRLREIDRELIYIFNQMGMNQPTQSQLNRLSVLSQEIDDIKEYIRKLKE
jgi:hypothetical protein